MEDSLIVEKPHTSVQTKIHTELTFSQLMSFINKYRIEWVFNHFAFESLKV